VPFKVRLLCKIKQGLLEKYFISRPHLREEGEVNSDDIGNAGITAGGLTVGVPRVRHDAHPVSYCRRHCSI